MKKTFVCIILAAALVSTLCGCGNGRIDDGIRDNPTVTPDMIPDTDDGVVKDEDGIIGDEKRTDGNSDANTNSGLNNGMTGGSTIPDTDESVDNGTGSTAVSSPSPSIAPEH